jgi:hypothetical protein
MNALIFIKIDVKSRIPWRGNPPHILADYGLFVRCRRIKIGSNKITAKSLSLSLVDLKLQLNIFSEFRLQGIWRCSPYQNRHIADKSAEAGILIGIPSKGRNF